MSDKYRSIAIDTPPALEFADAQIVSARAQGCLLVTKRHHTKLTDVDEVKRRLEPTGAAAIGFGDQRVAWDECCSRCVSLKRPSIAGRLRALPSPRG